MLLFQGHQTGDSVKCVGGCGRRMADGGQWVAGSGWRTADGGWWTADGGRRTADGGRRTADGGRRTADGGRRTADNHFSKKIFFAKKKRKRGRQRIDLQPEMIPCLPLEA